MSQNQRRRTRSCPRTGSGTRPFRLAHTPLLVPPHPTQRSAFPQKKKKVSGSFVYNPSAAVCDWPFPYRVYDSRSSAHTVVHLCVGVASLVMVVVVFFLFGTPHHPLPPLILPLSVAPLTLLKSFWSEEGRPRSSRL